MLNCMCNGRFHGGFLKSLWPEFTLVGLKNYFFQEFFRSFKCHNQ